MAAATFIRWFEDLTGEDVAQVGGKNASLGEMIGELRAEGVRVPGGFATTAAAYRAFVDHNDLAPRLAELTAAGSQQERQKQAAALRRAFRRGDVPAAIAGEIRDAYRELSDRHEQRAVAVAARSSATAEDLPQASFAGQQETFLNVRGLDDLLDACRGCYASLFTDRAVAYRQEHGFGHEQVALSVGVQKMVRSDRGSAGVMFSLDTDTGFRDVVVINGSWGLGETVVQGSVTPDEYRVFKPALADPDKVPILQKTLGEKEHKIVYAASGDQRVKTVETPRRERRRFVLADAEILQLARWACAIEAHYGRPMDMEWARDGQSGELFCVQARPETVQSRRQAGRLHTYRLQEEPGEPRVSGVAIGEAIARGPVKVLGSPDEQDRFERGDVLVTGRTDPDWGPILERAAAVVTDHGGRTSHAAIVSRELGIPAVVGAGDATDRLTDDQTVTVSCVAGEVGHVHDGALEFTEEEVDLDQLPDPPVPLMINIASPGGAMRWHRLPVAGIGLARMEFLVNNVIGVHPLALARFDQLEDSEVRQQIEARTAGHQDKTEYFVSHLARGVATIAASQYPRPVIVRLSDFKTNEYAQLLGGEAFEPHEENPMLGFRGAARYHSDRYRDGFALECRALRRAREEIGLENLVIMVPFVRTVEEADRVLATMAEHGLVRGEGGLQVFMMCEIPANIFRARQFARRFDGFSIGSNDLTQLVLGVDRDSEELRDLFDERDPAVQRAIAGVIADAHAEDVKVGLCGQAPSDHPDFARFLVDAGIDTISLNPDSVLEVLRDLTRTDGQRDQARGAQA
jgi:pyruvate,water dikinase